AAESLWRLQGERRRPLPACRVTRAGEPLALQVRSPERWLSLALEDGSRTSVPILDGEARLPPLPPGRHRLRLGDCEGHLIAAPPHAYEPPPLAHGERLFGFSAQLY